MRYLIALLAVAGIVVSVLALRVHYSTESAPCSINEKWDCGIVNHSPYAVIYGVPVAALGIAGYLLIAVLALARRRGLLLTAALVGMAFALYLTHIEASVLGVWCLYCVISQGVIAAITLLAIGWVVWRTRRTRSQLRLLRIKFARLHLVDIAPHPGFAGLNRAHQRMPDRMKVLRGVLVLRRIAAAHVPADQAHAKMYPAVAHLHALFTNVLAGLGDFDLVGMSTGLRHSLSPLELRSAPAPCGPNFPTSAAAS